MYAASPSVREGRHRRTYQSGRETRPQREKRPRIKREKGLRQPERLEHCRWGIPRDVLMVLEIENAPGQPKWVWLPSLAPIVSVSWNFRAKWRTVTPMIEVTPFFLFFCYLDSLTVFFAIYFSSYFIDRFDFSVSSILYLGNSILPPLFSAIYFYVVMFNK